MSNSYLTILDKLSKAVETNAKYKVEDALNKNLLAEDARKYDTSLLNLLQKDKDLKVHFFTETDGGLINSSDRVVLPAPGMPSKTMFILERYVSTSLSFITSGDTCLG